MQPHPQSPADTGAKFNALKHGLYAQTLVLPEEDLGAFRRSRQIAFLEFRPQTVDEAELLDEMVECRWQLKRCRPLQADADRQILHAERDAANRLTEPLTHQRTHTSMDVTVHRNRIDKLESRLRAKLHVSQKQRRLGLMEGAVKLPPGCYMEVTGEVVRVVETPRLPMRDCQVANVVPRATIPIPEIEADKTGATPSSNRPDGFYEEQKEMGTVQPGERPFAVLTPAAPHSDWPLHVNSAAWMTGHLDIPSSGGWLGVA